MKVIHENMICYFGICPQRNLSKGREILMTAEKNGSYYQTNHILAIL